MSSATRSLFTQIPLPLAGGAALLLGYAGTLWWSSRTQAQSPQSLVFIKSSGGESLVLAHAQARSSTAATRSSPPTQPTSQSVELVQTSQGSTQPAEASTVNTQIAAGKTQESAASPSSGATSQAATAGSLQPLEIADCDIYLIDHIKVAAVEAGPLARLLVQPGKQVQKGEVLFHLESEQAEATLRGAEAQYQLALVQQASPVDLEFAKKTEQLAKAEWDRVKSMQGSVTPAEAASVRFEWEKARLQITKAELDRKLSQWNAAQRQAERDLAQTALRRRSVVAPLSGVVLEVNRQQGEWLAVGEPVLTLARLDRLRVKTHLDASVYDPQALVERSGNLLVRLPGGQEETFAVHVGFISPVVDGDGRFEVWCEIENREVQGHWLLRPGLRGTLTIDLDPNPAPSTDVAQVN